MSYPPANLGPRSDSSPAVPSSHAADHTAERNAINAIVSELGADPSGTHATVMARLEAIEAAIVALGGSTGGGSGGSGGSGSGDAGGGSGGGTTPTSTPSGTSLGTYTFPIDVTSLGAPVSLSNNGRYANGWFTGDFSEYGLYANTLFVRVTGACAAVNMDNPSQYKTFSNVTSLLSAVLEVGGKVVIPVGVGSVLDLSAGTTASYVRSPNVDLGVAGATYLRLATSWIWVSTTAIMSLDDTTGAITSVADLPGAAAGEYECDSVSMSGFQCVLLMRSMTRALSDPLYWKIYTYSAFSGTFFEWASANHDSLPAVFKNNRGTCMGTSLSGNRFLGVVGGEITTLSTSMVPTATGVQLYGSGQVRQELLNGSSSLYAVVTNVSTGQMQINKATETYAEVLVGPTSDYISNIHWKPEHEGIVLRFNQGRFLKEIVV